MVQKALFLQSDFRVFISIKRKKTKMKKTFTLILSLSLMMTLNAQVKTANNSRKVLLADKEVQQKIAALYDNIFNDYVKV